jgi:hypothetical protein
VRRLSARSGEEPGDGYRIVAPEPAALIESLRAFGYTTETAIADLVDNSITAGARNIWVDFDWATSDSTVSISDDGSGMTEDELIEAMRPGSRSPLEERDRRDLGRFGLGLKTASFSQCRRTTVMSFTRKAARAGWCWDLDLVGETHEWRLVPVDWAERTTADRLTASKSGTVVLWEKLDRILGSDDEDASEVDAHKRFLGLARSVKEHLSVTYHRFMVGRKKVTFHVNGSKVESWDPFVSGMAGLQRLEPEQLPFQGELIKIQPYVLPHRSRFTDEEFARAGLGGRWNDLQGFFVYRNDRLLVAGDYLGLPFQKEEHYKLVRIAVDLPNTLDEHWQIDVRKSMAHPPGPLRRDLRRIATAARSKASEVYRYRGKALTRKASQGIEQTWSQGLRRGKITYSLNRSHPLVADFLSSLAPGQRRQANTVLKLVEETVPIPLIAINTSERDEEQALPYEGNELDLRKAAEGLYKTFISQGLKRADALARLGATDPFNLFPEIIATIAEGGSATSNETDAAP